jgi:hypothetical protein
MRQRQTIGMPYPLSLYHPILDPLTQQPILGGYERRFHSSWESVISWLLFVRSWTGFTKLQVKIHETNHRQSACHSQYSSITSSPILDPWTQQPMFGMGERPFHSSWEPVGADFWLLSLQFLTTTSRVLS